MDHPGALRHPADGEAVHRDGRFLRRACRSSGSRRRRRRRRPARARRRPRAGPETILSSGSSGPITPVERTRISSASRSSSRPASAAVASASSSPRSPVAAFATPELTTIACGSATSRCAFETTTGAASTWLTVNIAAPTAGPDRADDGEVLRRAPDARVDAGGGEALGGGDAHTSTPASLSPAVSGSPSARFAFCTAWPAAPLPRLSSAQTTIDRAGRAVGEDADLRRVGALDARELGRDPVRQHADDVAAGVRLLEQRAHVLVSRGRSRSRSARAGPAAGAGRSRRGSRAPARAPARAGASRPGTATTFSSTTAACEVGFSVRPAPETPDFASTTTPSGSIDPASGASASSAAVA